MASANVLIKRLFEMVFSTIQDYMVIAKLIRRLPSMTAVALGLSPSAPYLEKRPTLSIHH
ncbi:hypothetical protein IF1G_00597 [Cordyceps javanica]|uniref:Uncharacterized protein n=1 Tax=Cordyceps javanica TaxID=43265 RepID=A0A545VG17_9HYPO|nr:hypothetical protein IF1G_00597 [Cordyceps javanica]